MFITVEDKGFSTDCLNGTLVSRPINELSSNQERAGTKKFFSCKTCYWINSSNYIHCRQ